MPFQQQQRITEVVARAGAGAEALSPCKQDCGVESVPQVIKILECKDKKQQALSIQ